jgi:hypothetical protein
MLFAFAMAAWIEPLPVKEWLRWFGGPSDFPPALNPFVVGVGVLPIVEALLNDARLGRHSGKRRLRFARGGSVVEGY